MQQKYYASRDLTRATLAVLFVIVLIGCTVWVILPFVSAALWATMIVISTWPMMRALESRLGGRRGLATAVITGVLLLVLVIPLSLGVGALISNVDTIVAKLKSLQDLPLPPPPAWVAGLPIQGPKLYAQWQRLSVEGLGSLSTWLAPYAGTVLGWLAARVGGVGGLILQFLLTVLISAILYINGETAATGVRRFATRLAGPSGDKAAILAAGTIRGVAVGVIVTAVMQTLIAVVGLVIASIPGAGLLAAVIMMFNLAQVGPWLVMVPAVAWKFHSGDSVGGCVLLAFTLVAGTIDNFLRPVLIRKGANLPLLLIFAGVIGGIVSFGIMGIFVGPVILAVTYVLLREWVETSPVPWKAERVENRPKSSGVEQQHLIASTPH